MKINSDKDLRAASLRPIEGSDHWLWVGTKNLIPHMTPRYLRKFLREQRRIARQVTDPQIIVIATKKYRARRRRK